VGRRRGARRKYCFFFISSGGGGVADGLFCVFQNVHRGAKKDVPFHRQHEHLKEKEDEEDISERDCEKGDKTKPRHFQNT
jgi:hypothetical protein